MDLDPITEYIHDQLQYMLQENGLRRKKELYGIPSVLAQMVMPSQETGFLNSTKLISMCVLISMLKASLYHWPTKQTVTRKLLGTKEALEVLL